MELWDLFDAHGHPSGGTIRRGDAIPEGLYHKIIGVWTIHTTMQKILVTKRSFDKKICPGRWENTGGSIIAGEHERDGAAREVREEIGLPCQPADLEPITSFVAPGGLLVYSYVYRTTVPHDAITLQVGETIDYRWVSQEELEDIIARDRFARPEILQYGRCRAHLFAILSNL